MPIDFTQKKAAPRPSTGPKDEIIPAGKANIPKGFAKRASAPAPPSVAELNAASAQSPLQHPGDKPATLSTPRPKGEGAKPSKPRKKPNNGLVPEIPVELYIRGTARKSVLIEGPEQTIEAFKAFVKKRGVKNWQALQLLVQNEGK